MLRLLGGALCALGCSALMSSRSAVPSVVSSRSAVPSVLQRRVSCEARRCAMSRHGFVYVAAAVTLAPLSSSAAFPVADPTKCRGWLAIIDGGAKALADLLRDWETITAKNDGDAVRRYLGTVGDSSPLSQLRPALQGVLRASDLPAAFDDGAFAEASEDVLADLRAAEGVAYGSNFADYSTSVGSGGLSPAATQIKQSRAYVLKAQRSYAALVATLEPLR